MAVIGPVVDGWEMMAEAFARAGTRVLSGGRWEMKIATNRNLTANDIAALQAYADNDLRVSTVIAGSNHGGSDTIRYLSGVQANEILIGGTFLGAGLIASKMARFVAGVGVLAASAVMVRLSFDEDGASGFTESVREFGAAAGAASGAIVWPWLLLIVALIGANEYRKRR